MGLELPEIESLYRERQMNFFRVALGLLDGDRERAHDAVQEAFARAIRAREGFRGDGSAEAWVWRTLTNVCVREGQRRVPVAAETGDAVVGAASPVAEADELRKAVTRLPERQRLMLFLRHYADLDYQRIAEIAGVERGTVAATLSAAHAALRKEMTERVLD